MRESKAPALHQNQAQSGLIGAGLAAAHKTEHKLKLMHTHKPMITHPVQQSTRTANSAMTVEKPTWKKK